MTLSTGDIIMYIMCALSGTFFSVFMFTSIENFSGKFRDTVNRYTARTTAKFRGRISIAVFVIVMPILLIQHPYGVSTSGIAAGAIFGIPLYFRSGVTMNKTIDMGKKYTKRSKTEKQAAQQKVQEDKAAKPRMVKELKKK